MVDDVDEAVRLELLSANEHSDVDELAHAPHLQERRCLPIEL